MLNHIPHQAIDGDWHVVYVIPGTDSLHSVLSGLPDKGTATREAQRINREQPRDPPPAHPDRLARPIVKGFYTDGDAA